ncbi:hypothetical protein C8R43DRAFT_1023974 [Mycena crocata]|nr:hypothetical protein C8R43DRAFT_1023974 [Mycena crocata]
MRLNEPRKLNRPQQSKFVSLFVLRLLRSVVGWIHGSFLPSNQISNGFSRRISAARSFRGVWSHISRRPISKLMRPFVTGYLARCLARAATVRSALSTRTIHHLGRRGRRRRSGERLGAGAAERRRKQKYTHSRKHSLDITSMHTRLTRTYPPGSPPLVVRLVSVNPNPNPGKPERSRERNSSSSPRASCCVSLPDTHRAQAAFMAHPAGCQASRHQRSRKRRRVDSRPRQESSTSGELSSSSSRSITTASSSSTSDSSSAANSSSQSQSASISRSSSASSSSRPVSSSSRPISSSPSSRPSSRTSSVSSTSPSISVSLPPSTSPSSSSTLSTQTPSTPPSLSTPIVLSTIIVTSNGGTSTVVTTSSPSGVLGRGTTGGGDAFAHNVGGIVGVAVGGFVALILGGTLLFFACKRFRRRRERGVGVRPGTQRAVGVEMNPSSSPRLPTTPNPNPTQQIPTQLEIPPPAEPLLDPRRPTMPPTPPSSSSLTGLLTRIRGGAVRYAPGELQGAGALAHPMPRVPTPASFISPGPRISTPISPAFPRASTPASGIPRSPTPAGSLLNPRVNPDSAPTSPVLPEWVPPAGWRGSMSGSGSGSNLRLSGSGSNVGGAGAAGWGRGAEVTWATQQQEQKGSAQQQNLQQPWISTQQQQPSPAASEDDKHEQPGMPTAGLLRPSLAVLQAHAHSFRDDEDYSRPIGGVSDSVEFWRESVCLASLVFHWELDFFSLLALSMSMMYSRECTARGPSDGDERDDGVGGCAAALLVYHVD